MSKPGSSTAPRAAEPNGSRWQARAMPTMDDVARESGFSQMTVSRAFLESASIRKETRERILKVADGDRLLSQQGRLLPRLAALARLRHHPADLQDSIYLPFVEAARRVFESHRADYILQTIDYARGRESYAIGSLLSQRVQVIMLPSIGHTRGHATVPRDPADPAYRGRQPAEEADRFRRRPFRFRGRLSRDEAADRDRAAQDRDHLRLCPQHLERARPLERLSPRDAGGRAAARRKPPGGGRALDRRRPARARSSA